MLKASKAAPGTSCKVGVFGDTNCSVHTHHASVSGTTGEAPSQLSTFTEKQQQMKKLEELTHQLHEMTCEADELRQFLANYTDKDLNNRLNFEFEMLKMEHNQVVSDQLKLPREISKAVDKCNQLMEETESVGCRHGQVLRDRTQLKKKVHVLRLKNILLRKEKIELQETCEEAKRLLKEAHEKICGPCAEQQQEQESLEEGLKNVLKQKELVTQHGDLAEKLQHHLSVPEMRAASGSVAVLAGPHQACSITAFLFQLRKSPVRAGTGHNPGQELPADRAAAAGALSLTGNSPEMDLTSETDSESQLMCGGINCVGPQLVLSN
ncbi:hypothetical protein ACRRTK_019698 [Alexandromys fortis]